MRIRSIKPEFWTSEDIAKYDWSTRLLFVGLWSYVDDNGVGRDNEKLIKSSLFPLEDDPRETLATVSRGLQELSRGGQITRYTVEGKDFLCINSWGSHQRIDKPNKPRYPRPDAENSAVRDTLATLSRDPRESPAPGAGEQGSRGAGEQGSRAADKPRKKPATTIPDDWKPNAKHQTYATERGVDLSSEAFRFRNHAHSVDRRCVNWNAAFTNWLSKAYPDRNQPRTVNDKRPEGW